LEIKYIKEIEVLSSKFEVIWDKTMDGGSFDFSKCTITIGIKNVRKDPNYVLSVISHELMELILETMGARYLNGRSDYFVFNFDHRIFEVSILAHMQAFSKFIK